MPSSKLDVAVQINLKDKLTRPLRNMANGFKRFNSTLAGSRDKFAALNKQMSKAGKGAMKVGGKMSRRLTLPLLAAGGAAIKLGMDFNKGMANVASLIPGNSKRIKQLSNDMLKLSTDTGASTSDITAGLYQVVSAFGDSADTSEKMRVAVKAATAGVATTTDAINLLSAVTKGYGDTSAKAIQTTSDLAFLTVKLGQTTFPELAASMGQVVPMASALSVSQTELFGTMAALTGVTGNTAAVATQVRGAMAALIKPTTDMKKTIKGLGYESADAMIKQLGLVGALRKIAGTTGGSKEKLAALFGRVEALNAVMAITSGKTGKDFDNKLKQLKNSAGATDAAFKAQTEGVNKAGFTWKKMIATMKVLAIKVGQVLLPILAKLATVLSDVMNFFMNLPGPVKNFLLVLAGVAAAIGPFVYLIGLFRKFRIAIKMAKLMMGSFGKAMMMNPVFLKIGLIVAGIVALVSILKKSTVNIKENLEASRELTTGIDKLAKAYDKAGTAAGKLTDEQKAQLKLKMLETNQKALKQMEDNYTKLNALAEQSLNQQKGSIEYEKTRTEYQLLQFKNRRLQKAYEKSQTYLGRSDTETKLQLSALQQKFSRGTGAQGLSFTTSMPGMESAGLGNYLRGRFSGTKSELGIGAGGVSLQAKGSTEMMGVMGKQLTEWINKSALKANLNIHIKNDGSATATVQTKGGKINTTVTAQNVKNGRTRK